MSLCLKVNQKVRFDRSSEAPVNTQKARALRRMERSTAKHLRRRLALENKYVRLRPEDKREGCGDADSSSR